MKLPGREESSAAMVVLSSVHNFLLETFINVEELPMPYSLPVLIPYLEKKINNDVASKEDLVKLNMFTASFLESLDVRLENATEGRLATFRQLLLVLLVDLLIKYGHPEYFKTSKPSTSTSFPLEYRMKIQKRTKSLEVVSFPSSILDSQIVPLVRKSVFDIIKPDLKYLLHVQSKEAIHYLVNNGLLYGDDISTLKNLGFGTYYSNCFDYLSQWIVQKAIIHRGMRKLGLLLLELPNNYQEVLTAKDLLFTPEKDQLVEILNFSLKSHRDIAMDVAAIVAPICDNTMKVRSCSKPVYFKCRGNCVHVDAAFELCVKMHICSIELLQMSKVYVFNFSE